ncbi:MAG TPA: DUF6526 family protein [Chitinophagaceae bacterium]|nr:hypothetical protein [Chitinophagaceae bacterium]MCB9055881.1 hypothetical protein [Chitinophagales bacterium]HRX93963.1 DUF6526 family protein [Chitinophagaceae bacterium]
MQEQNYKNHSRYVPLYHFLTSGLILLGLGGSIVNLIKADPHTHYSAALLVIAFIIMIFLFWFARAFALRAQDRAIRAEENFRHYILTGNPLPKEIRMGQVIALRFASDEEFPELTKRAVEEKLSQKEIKQAVKNWRTDYNRA